MSETRALAEYVVNNRIEDIPADVRHEARRAIVNYMGCAVGGASAGEFTLTGALLAAGAAAGVAVAPPSAGSTQPGGAKRSIDKSRGCLPDKIAIFASFIADQRSK